MRPVRLRSSRKFCPSDFLADRPCRRIDVAQRRQIVDRAHLPRASASARTQPRREPQRRDQARRAGAAGAGDVERGAVVGRGAHEGQAERDVDRFVEGERLDRDQRLIVIHAERGVVGLAARPRGTSCRPAAARARRCLRDASCATAGAMMSRSSSPSVPSSPACGLSPATASRGSRDAEARVQIARDDAAGLDDQIAASAAAGTSRSGRWIVTGTTASSGDHSIITGMRGLRRCAPAASLARYSVWPGSGSPRDRAPPWRSGW